MNRSEVIAVMTETVKKNKPGPAQVGAISKVQQAENGQSRRHI